MKIKEIFSEEYTTKSFKKDVKAGYNLTFENQDEEEYPRMPAATPVPSTPGWNPDEDNDDEDDPDEKLFKFEDDDDDDDDDDSFDRIKQLAGVNSHVTTSTKNTGGTWTTGGGTTTRTAITNKDNKVIDVITSKTLGVNKFTAEK